MTQLSQSHRRLSLPSWLALCVSLTFLACGEQGSSHEPPRDAQASTPLPASHKDEGRTRRVPVTKEPPPSASPRSEPEAEPLPRVQTASPAATASPIHLDASTQDAPARPVVRRPTAPPPKKKCKGGTKCGNPVPPELMFAPPKKTEVNTNP
jgi:hypothetical protein